MMYQCMYCGLSSSHTAIGSVLPQCQCRWNQNSKDIAMNREDTIRMIKEAGISTGGHPMNPLSVYPSDLERFAEIVRKDYSFTHAQMWLKRFDDAIKAEREACAKICENADSLVNSTFQGVAEAIRARSKE